MFIAQGQLGQSKNWYYVLGFIIILFFWQILGSIPLIGVIIKRTFQGNLSWHEIVGSGMAGIREGLGLSKNSFLLLMLSSFAIGFIGVYIAVKYCLKRSLLSMTTSREQIDWKRVFLSFSIVAAYSIIITLISYFSNPEELALQFHWESFLILLIISVLLIPIQTSLEEYIFRGYLMQWIGIKSKNRWLPLLLTSLFFGILHGANPEVSKMGDVLLFYYIGTGVFLGVLTLMDEGMELNLGFHAANNLIGALLVTSDWSVLQTDAIFKDLSEPQAGWETFFPLLVIYPILLLIFAKVYHWKGWKEKLFGRVAPPAI